jgi:hypothetical protein
MDKSDPVRGASVAEEGNIVSYRYEAGKSRSCPSLEDKSLAAGLLTAAPVEKTMEPVEYG